MSADTEAAIELAEAVLATSIGGRLAPDVPEKLNYLLILAFHGWQDAHDALCGYASQLTEEDHPLPKGLQVYVVETARKGFTPNKKKFSKMNRDLAICLAIRELLDCGYAATRNEASRYIEGAKESGCSIVSAALARSGNVISEVGVEKIWNKKGKGSLEGPPLADA